MTEPNGNGMSVDEVVRHVMARKQEILDQQQNAFIWEHSPHILAALIVRRASTDPEHLIEAALDTVRRLYDTLKQNTGQNTG